MSKKLPIWLRQQKKRKLAKVKKLVFLVFFVLLSAVVLAGLTGFFVLSKNSYWKSNSRLNLVFNSSPVVVFSLDPQMKIFYLFILDDDLYAKVEDSDYFKLTKVFQLGELDGKGHSLLKKTTQNLLSVPIDSTVDLNGEDLNFVLKDEALTKKFFKDSFAKFIGSGHHSLSGWDFLKLRFALSGKARPVLLTLDESYAKKTNLADGQEVLVLDNKKLDNIYKFFLDEEINREGLAVAVRNSTEKQGLGKSVAKMLANIGARIVDVSSLDQKVEQSCILKADRRAADSYTFKKIRSFFNCEFQEGIDQSTRAEIVLIIGDGW